MASTPLTEITDTQHCFTYKISYVVWFAQNTNKYFSCLNRVSSFSVTTLQMSQEKQCSKLNNIYFPLAHFPSSHQVRLFLPMPLHKKVHKGRGCKNRARSKTVGSGFSITPGRSHDSGYWLKILPIPQSTTSLVNWRKTLLTKLLYWKRGYHRHKCLS